MFSWFSCVCRGIKAELDWTTALEWWSLVHSSHTFPIGFMTFELQNKSAYFLLIHPQTVSVIIVALCSSLPPVLWAPPTSEQPLPKTWNWKWRHALFLTTVESVQVPILSIRFMCHRNHVNHERGCRHLSPYKVVLIDLVLTVNSASWHAVRWRIQSSVGHEGMA